MCSINRAHFPSSQKNEAINFSPIYSDLEKITVYFLIKFDFRRELLLFAQSVIGSLGASRSWSSSGSSVHLVTHHVAANAVVTNQFLEIIK